MEFQNYFTAALLAAAENGYKVPANALAALNEGPEAVLAYLAKLTTAIEKHGGGDKKLEAAGIGNVAKNALKAATEAVKNGENLATVIFAYCAEFAKVSPSFGMTYSLRAIFGRESTQVWSTARLFAAREKDARANYLTADDFSEVPSTKYIWTFTPPITPRKGATGRVKNEPDPDAEARRQLAKEILNGGKNGPANDNDGDANGDEPKTPKTKKRPRLEDLMD